MLEEILFLLVLFGANVIQGITGFAGTLLAMPASILLIGPDKAKAILNIMAVLSCSIIVVQSLRYVDVRELLKIIAAMLFGMAAGMYAYAACPLSYLIPVYGAFVMAVGARNLYAKKPLPSRGKGLGPFSWEPASSTACSCPAGPPRRVCGGDVPGQRGVPQHPGRRVGHSQRTAHGKGFFQRRV